jgi:hypothetical protein
MKTQLIPLESHDDLISVRDRMSWAKTPRILLVWPASERIALRPLDLKVLQRHAASLGAQLGLVTRHRTIRREAVALGIPVFISTGEAQRSVWPERKISTRVYQPPKKNLRDLLNQSRIEEGQWRNLFPVRLGAFALGVLAVLALLSLFIPRAQIVLDPELEVQSMSLPVQANATADAVSLTGIIPLRQMRVIVKVERQGFTSGSMAIPETKSQGMVTFRNLTENPVRIPVGTVLLSTGLPGIRFETVEPAQLLGGVNESAVVAIQAELAGASGNVEAETIQAIEGNLGLSVVVSNEEPTSGGKDQLTRAPTDEDRAQLLEALLDSLQVEAASTLETGSASGDVILSDSIEVLQILEETYDPPIGQPGQKVTLTLEIEFSAAYISGKDLTQMATTVFNTSLPSGYIVAESPVEFEKLGSYQTMEPGVVSWTMSASRTIKRRITPDQVFSLVKGLPVADAEKMLSANLPLRSPPVIQIKPAWWPWLPLNPLNYAYTVQ